MGGKVTALWDQDSFAWYTDAGGEGTNQIGSTNSNPSTLVTGTQYRLRYLIQETAGSNQVETPVFELEYRVDPAGGTTFGSWTPIDSDDTYFTAVSSANVTDNGFWNFKRLVGHEGPLKASDPEHKSSRYNVLVEWENGEITPEPLNVFGKDEPVTCAVYAREHGLLEEEGWRRFKGHLERVKRIFGYLRKMEEARTQMLTKEPDCFGC